MSEEKKDTTKQSASTTNKSKKRSFEFFSEDSSYMPKIERTTPSVHPHEHYEDFSINPPIPVFNYIIDNKTLEIIEDKTGQP